MSILIQIQELVAATLKLPPEKVTPTTRSEDLAAWDSLGQVNVMMALEQTFDVYVEAEELAGLNSVPAILEFLNDRGIA